MFFHYSFRSNLGLYIAFVPKFALFSSNLGQFLCVYLSGCWCFGGILVRHFIECPTTLVCQISCYWFDFLWLRWGYELLGRTPQSCAPLSAWSLGAYDVRVTNSWGADLDSSVKVVSDRILHSIVTIFPFEISKCSWGDNLRLYKHSIFA